MQLTLQGLTILVSGSIPGMSRILAMQAISAGGGIVCKNISAKVDVVVFGARAGQNKIDKARAMGLTEIDADQFLELVREGTLTLEDEAEPDERVSDVIGDVRALFDGHHDTSTWARLTDLLDRCAPEALDELVAYAEGYVSRWEVDSTRRWLASRQSHALAADRILGGDMRMAPVSWVQELMQEQHSPKHALVRALSLDDTRANTTMASKIFGSPHLSGLQVLDTSRMLKLSKTFFRKLGAAEHMSELHTLFVYPREGVGELAKATTLTRVRHLHIRATAYSRYSESQPAVDTIFAADWMSQIETLESARSWSTHWVTGNSIFSALAANADRFTSLKRLITSDTNDIADAFDAGIPERLEELVLATGSHGALYILDELDKHDTPNLRHIDVSPCFLAPPHRLSEEMKELRHALPGRLAKIAGQVGRVPLGPGAPHETAKTPEGSEAVTAPPWCAPR